MYGRIFESMYTGSMRGSGALMFAVWPYVLAHMRGDNDRAYFTVELNTEVIAFLIGEKPEDVGAIIERCCQPDPHSRRREKEGRKLVKLGPFLYEVVNGGYYESLKRESDRRASNRRYQEEFRNKKKPRRDLKPMGSERQFVNALQSGESGPRVDRMTDPTDS